MQLCHPRLQRQAFPVMAIALALAGCASPAPESWRVAPNYRIAHAGASADLGYRALARQYEGERRWREARDAWRKAALATPEDADTLNALGMAEAGQGLYGNAIAALRRAVALAPQRTALLNNLGYALLLDGQNDEARSVLQEALARSPEHLLAHANLNRIHQLPGGVSPSPALSVNATAKPDLAALSPAHPGRLNLQSVPNLAPLPLRQAGFTEPIVRAAPNAPPRIEIANGNGVTGLAVSLRGWLRARGFAHNPHLTNVRPFNTAITMVHYRVGYFAVAQELVQHMPQHVELAPEPSGVHQADIRVILGRDLRAIDRGV